MSILGWIQPVDSTTIKNVFISAFRFTTSTDNSLPPFTNELKTSAQEQVEYMLMEDEDLPLITTDDDVKVVVEIGLAKLFSKLSSGIWAVKVRLIEVTAKVLEVVGYGNVILPAPSRVQLLKL
ncbi:hypothetical protein ACLOJK_034731 [Asimina triloba]